MFFSEYRQSLEYLCACKHTEWQYQSILKQKRLAEFSVWPGRLFTHSVHLVYIGHLTAAKAKTTFYYQPIDSDLQEWILIHSSSHKLHQRPFFRLIERPSPVRPVVIRSGAASWSWSGSWIENPRVWFSVLSQTLGNCKNSTWSTNNGCVSSPIPSLPVCPMPQKQQLQAADSGLPLDVHTASAEEQKLVRVCVWERGGGRLKGAWVTELGVCKLWSVPMCVCVCVCVRGHWKGQMRFSG